MTVLSLAGARASYGGERALGPIDLSVAAGERVALVGRSGAGKSTLLKLLHDPARRDIAIMPQELGLVDSLSVFHNVYMGRLNRHTVWYNLANLVRPMKTEQAAVRAVLEPLGMAERIRSRAGELSGGQRQRVAVGRCLYQDADILLADEPVSALDGPRANGVMQALTAAYGTAVLALHDIELALRYSDRVVGLNDGHIVLDEPSDRLTEGDLAPLYAEPMEPGRATG